MVAERMKGAADIRLVTPGADILEQAPLGQRQAAARALAADGVQVIAGTKVGAGACGRNPAAGRGRRAGCRRLAGASLARPGDAPAARAATRATCLARLQVNSLAAVPGAEEQPASGRCVLDLSVPGAAGDGGAEASSSGSGGSSQLAADLVVWTAGFSPVTKAARQGFPFPASPRGSLETVSSRRRARP